MLGLLEVVHGEYRGLNTLKVSGDMYNSLWKLQLKRSQAYALHNDEPSSKRFVGGLGCIADSTVYFWKLKQNGLLSHTNTRTLCQSDWASVAPGEFLSRWEAVKTSIKILPSTAGKLVWYHYHCVQSGNKHTATAGMLSPITTRQSYQPQTVQNSTLCLFSFVLCFKRKINLEKERKNLF